MLKIANIVKEVLEQDDIAIQSMEYGIMNFSGYARKIQPIIEERLLKKVELKSIIVALLRISKEERTQFIPSFKIKNISIHLELEELDYERTKENLEKIRNLYSLISPDEKSFFVITEGVNEITIIATKDIVEKIKSLMSEIKVNYEVPNLSGITIKFPSEDIVHVPNVTYNLIKRLAVKNINVIETVSTVSELTFIVESKDTERAIGQFNNLVQ